ncbi:NAD(P)H-hydrate dehydratase [Croceicoccus sp. YJ47]|uniref:NAD(P)H-hydrate dehydratase n=1 Tax=Croceicoccus sp. YJ47 TaxID=2798724 RepID=UPI001922D118|nr:NAD(P)H-hydrate dehydratase [Croceicoccus sp. YJ47]QQN73800.1 NAD(P)H-hydrate dehydratase [Croceicoccus sp. YJ47]
MHNVGAQVLSVAQMRSAEERLIAGGSDVDTLMQRAGRGAAHLIRRMAPGAAITVLCGPGNNGGDGYVIARALLEWGHRVAVVAAMEPGGDAARRAAAACDAPRLEPDAAKGDVLVDCLFGSGLNRRLSDELQDMLIGLASRHDRLVAVDLPSGIGADDGALLADELPRYDLCIALGAWKRAHYLMPAMAHWGMVRLIDIGVERADGRALLVEKPRLSAPAMDAHKYRRGLIAVVGGQMPGAGMLAARAAGLAGAGYVKLLSQRRIVDAPADLVTMKAPGDVSLGREIGDERVAALLIGPGLGRDADARERLGQVLSADRPTVLDADALVMLRLAMMTRRASPLIVTPHEGELSGLEDLFGLAGEGSKPERALALAAEMDALVIAKGPDTVIATPQGRLAFAPSATSWLSVAGSGDVLAGIVAARLGVTGQAWDAAMQAVWLHGEAARHAGPAFTAAMLAQSVQDAVAAAL